MGRKEENVKYATTIMKTPEFVRNIGTAAHIDHGKTTFSDNLIAGAGMMSEDLAGKQCVLDFDEQEAARGITINAASASMVHHFEGKSYLINLIDTPGHVDFGGDVTRAMRALDGVFILCCAVEGIMPQTETVIRQALKERVKPMLFINKVDRMIVEQQVTKEMMIERFSKLIATFNEKIKANLPAPLNKEWQVSIQDGTVAFGSAYNNWAISAPFMKKSGISFSDIFDYCSKEGGQKELAHKSPLHEVALEMAIRHIQPPTLAQKVRIPIIWKGDLESKVGKELMNCDASGDVVLMVTKIIMDKHAGEVAVGRLFSGTIQKGQTLYVAGQPAPQRVQTVALMVGADRIAIDDAKAGNIVAVTGLKDAIAGSTVSSMIDMEPFEKMAHYSEPVVTEAIEAKDTKDLPKLVEVLRTVGKADPSLAIEINNETGEHLIAGMGELHLEITVYRIENEQGIPIVVSPPIVVYRECVKGKNAGFEGRSPNKHNKFTFVVSRLEQGIIDAIHKGEIDPDAKIKDPKALAKQLQDLGMTDAMEAKGVVKFKNDNVLIDYTKGIQYLHETMELIADAFDEAMTKGPLAAEKVSGLKVVLMDAKLHEDTIHRGPAQIIPAVRDGIYGAMCQAGRVLLEPMQHVFISVPPDFTGNVISLITQRRGTILEMGQDGADSTVSAKCPVADMFGFTSDIRGATQGRALWSTENAGFEEMFPDLQEKVVGEIRTRKGLNPQPYDANYYSGL
ncbi:Translation elongation factor 2 [Candidatus Methanomethylophilus alvi Mx1201]|uniref:Elongation factor 2 n=2 Tax=Methanomethylophilus alvi TaxID=1291540 RepID=M9SBA2_METAX|nr:elongation factor EF-2 [Methanomethylophilus alvi]CDF31328.1 elongation factor 2 [Methanoculleus sp. CAG:1088]AGI85074.1 Translation elongation factor 2 [Candidatus Methanomethylophilus alvi Mx1201]AYQ54511.1 elongation factor EF-2 [Methanomethylophilus alvi]MCI5974255.1 elongation factor EF-2 [Methanomethylophilus alvi]MDY7060495.1 elongation factor EF-2 [Methanomethylophilus alvi]